MKKILFQTLTLALLFLTACEEQPIDVSQMAPDSNRKILIEEFTGANCAACPRGAELIKTLQAEYGDQIVAIAIHTNVSGFLGEPLEGSAYDLRTNTGDELADLFAPLSGIPAAVFNRTKIGDDPLLVLIPDTWPTKVLGELAIDPIVDVTTDIDYNDTTRVLTITVDALALVDQTGDFRIGVAITESHIIDKQNNDSVTDTEYEHNHILRKYITSIEGDPLTSELLINTTTTKTYTFQVPEEDGTWIAENLSVVSFVSEVNAEDGTFKVLQADEEHFGE